MTYEEFLVSQATYGKNIRDYLAQALAMTVFGVNLEDVHEPQVFKRAAEHLEIVFRCAGWQFMFDEDGTFKGVIT